MSVEIEDAMAALFAQLSAVTDWQTAGRRVQHWQQVPNQPAFFLRRTGVTYERDEMELIRTIECEAWIYCNAGQDPAAAPDAELTVLERKVHDAMPPDTDHGDPRFTLGGLVYWCRIEGKSDVAPGDQGPQAIARIPIRITLP